MGAINRFFDNDRQLKIIYLIATAVSLIAFFLCPRVNFLDTATFYTAKDVLLRGELDIFRTPIYPLFLAVTVNPTGVFIAQTIFFLLSVRFFYKALKILADSKKLVLIFSLVYVLHPTILFYNFQLLSESLSISFSAIYLYFLIAYIQSGKNKYCWGFTVAMLFLIFLKPACIILLGVSVGLLFYFTIFKRLSFRPLAVFVVSFAVQLSAIGGYMAAMHEKYGVYGISNVTDMNFFWIMDMLEMTDESTFPDDKIKAIENNVNRCWFIFNEYGWSEAQKIVRKNLKINYKEYLFGKRMTDKRMINCLASFTNVSGKNGWKVVAGSLGLSFYQLFMFWGLYIFLFVRYWVIKKKIPVVSLILMGISLMNCIVIYINSIDDYSRFVVPSLTAILLQFFQISAWGIAVIRRKPYQWA
jgi:hypothetical protein